MTAKAYGAITVDTSILKGAGYRLEEGVLATLSQFAAGGVLVLMTEVVKREMRGHLLHSAIGARDAAVKHITDMGQQQLLLASLVTEQKQKLERIDLDAAVDARIDAFFEAISAQEVEVWQADLGEVVDTYFDNKAPFGDGKKKSEFPDAIALLGLEAWAKDRNCKILAVSADKGWNDFAEKSDWIDVVEDLPSGIARFQEHVGEIAQRARDFLIELAQDKRPDFKSYLKSLIGNDIALTHLWGNAKSENNIEIEFDSMDVTLLDVDFSNPQTARVIQIESSTISFLAECELSLHTIAHFTAWMRSPDATMLEHVGPVSKEMNVLVWAQIFVKISNDLDLREGDPILEEANIAAISPGMNFGFIDV